MSNTLEVAILIASVAFTVLIICLIPIVFRIWRQLERLMFTSERLHQKIEILVDDGDDLVRNLADLAKRASGQLDDVGQMVYTAREWIERADRLVDEIGSAVEPPVHSLVRNMNLFRAGVTTFLRILLHRNQHNDGKKEADHV